MSLPSNVIDIIATQILLDTKGVLESLKNLDPKVESSATRIAMISKSLQAMAESAGVSIDTMAQKLQKLNAAGGGKFGTLGITNTDISRATQVAQGIQAVGVAAESAKKPIGDLEPQVKKTSNAFASMINVVKGALTAMLTLAALRAVTDFFKNALKAATEFRGKLAELNFAEAILSQKGMDITKAEFDKFISDIESKVKYLSTLEVTGIVADVANMGAEFNIAKKDVIGLAEAIAFMQVSEKAFGQEISTSSSIINAALDGRSNYFNRYGINITKTAIKEKAYAMGLTEVGSAISKEISNQAAIALLIEQTSGKFDELLASIEKVNPALANQMRVSKKLKDSQLEVGNAVLKVKDAWNSFLSVLIKSGSFDELVNGVIAAIDAFAGLITIIGNAADAYGDFKKLTEKDDSSTGFEKWIGPLQTIFTVIQLIFLGLTSVIGALISTIGVAADLFALATGKKNLDEAGLSMGQHLSDGILAGLNIGLKPLLEGKNDPISNAIRKTMEKLNEMYASFNPKLPEIPDTPTSEIPFEVSLEETAAFDELSKDLAEVAAEAQNAYEELQRLTTQKAIDIQDMVLESYINMAMTLFAVERGGQVQPHLDIMDTKGLNYHVPENLSRMANSAVHSKDYQWAKKFYQEITNLDPGVADNWVNLALAYAYLGDRQNAINTARKVGNFGGQYASQSEAFISDVLNGVYEE